VQWRTRRAIDDSLDAFGVHGVGGTVGALATGLFASIGATGLLLGNARQLGIQALAVIATAAYAIVVSFVILKVLDLTIGLRVGDREEIEGLDLSQHGEAAYTD
jgi:Amt family ammonium transporter